MKAPTREQIDAWCRLKFGNDTGNRAYMSSFANERSYICNPDHGWIEELSPAQIRSVHIWTAPLSIPSQGTGT